MVQHVTVLLSRTRQEQAAPGKGTYYYDWVNNRLRLVQLTPVGSYSEADP